MKRRHILLAPALLAPALARAQGGWRPNRPVTMIVPYAAGGGTDIVGREFAQILSQKIGQTVVVDNRGGAGGSIGTLAAVRARGDGFTFLYAVSSNIVINPHVYRTPEREDPARVLIPVGILANYQYILVGNPRWPVTNLQELIAQARAKPGEVTFSHSGNGGNNHLAGKLLARMAGIELSDVAYRGTSPALMDAVNGTVQFNISSPPPAIPLVREGQLRPIAVTGARRSPTFPDVPTVAEQGLPGYAVTGWHGAFFPPGTPAEPVAALRAAVAEIAAMPAFHEKLGRDGLEPLAAPVSTEAFIAQVRDEHAFWGRTIPELGIRVE
ncbi:Bug family tripartite tricarboxylate transporter substrate binding protein [Neoroseomonas oryzicola]|uniref:Tripartite tricarboxylate transporter substrate binding protein n=1 Tax=Neoroseomonas oryzicola TaxID=535904 RepID=A0A9X9WJF0_9PROT|nr:tripartite tricarboxylate transporter substrate binding protein [Neoroseomonas oryzicola]MBR0660460.1 tripartite tricarboxylate transporter substrate binding protein [Neoroseomonas oryzicola]NKE18228.1 tripartite tricarboxylate transporter substrate binding protein [Neoroseomonas oryzicola]